MDQCLPTFTGNDSSLLRALSAYPAPARARHPCLIGLSEQGPGTDRKDLLQFPESQSFFESQSSFLGAFGCKARAGDFNLDRTTRWPRLKSWQVRRAPFNDGLAQKGCRCKAGLVSWAHFMGCSCKLFRATFGVSGRFGNALYI